MQSLKEIESDKISGSSKITYNLVIFLEKKLVTIKGLNRQKKFLKQVQNAVLMAHPCMASLHNFFLDLYVHKDPLLFLKKYRADYKSIFEKIAQKVAKSMKEKKTLLTFSRSSTVEKILIFLKQKKIHFQVIVAESRPAFEGRELAENLSLEKIPIKLMSDAACFSMVPSVDAVILGADWISQTFFVNKMGSYPLAFLANANKKPLWIFSETAKILSSKKMKFENKQGPKKEIFTKKRKNLEILNSYFERTPLKYVDRIFTEKTVIYPKNKPIDLR